MSSINRRTAIVQMSALAGGAVLGDGLGAEGLVVNWDYVSGRFAEKA